MTTAHQSRPAYPLPVCTRSILVPPWSRLNRQSRTKSTTCAHGHPRLCLPSRGVEDFVHINPHQDTHSAQPSRHNAPLRSDVRSFLGGYIQSTRAVYRIDHVGKRHIANRHTNARGSR